MPIENRQWLHTLFSSLSEYEAKFFKERLKGNSAIHHRESKMLQFVTQLEKQAEIPKSERNRKMTTATEDQILNFLLDDINLKKRKGISFRNISLNKKLLKARTLFTQGCIQRSLEHLNALLRSKHLEQDLLLQEQVYSFKLSVLATTGNQEEFLKTLALKSEIEYKRSLETKAIRIYHQSKLRSFQNFDGNQKVLIKHSLNQISQIKSKHCSDTIEFIFYMINANCLEIEDSPSEAINEINKASKYTEAALTNNLIHSQLELASHKARLYFNDGNTVDASFSASICEENSPTTTYVYLQGLKIQFLINHLKNKHSANNWIENTNLSKKIINSQTNNNDIVSWYYLKMCHYHQEDYNLNKCINTIAHINSSYKFSIDLNIYLRLHKITALISLQQLDQADKEIESLRKFIQRNKAENILKKHKKLSLYSFLRLYKATGYQEPPPLHIQQAEQVTLNASYDHQGYLDIYCFKNWAKNLQPGQYTQTQSSLG